MIHDMQNSGRHIHQDYDQLEHVGLFPVYTVAFWFVMPGGT